MASVAVGGKCCQAAEGESVLATLLRHGFEIPYSCRRGSCHICLLRCTSGVLADAAQAGLRDTLREQAYFLACQCVPVGDLTVELPDVAATYSRAILRGRDRLAEDVYRLLLEPAAPFPYRAGQFVNLRRADGVVRSFSLASLPDSDPCLDLHVRRRPNGTLSRWLCDDLAIGEAVGLQGPNGACFYTGGRPDGALLLVGTGTGLAPLLGIAREALARGHRGPIHLYHGARAMASLYGHEMLRCLAAAQGNFRYVRCLSGEKEGDDVLAGRADDLALARHPDLSAWRVYLCGAPPMVHGARKRAFLAGAALQDIYADPFESKDLRRVPRP